MQAPTVGEMRIEITEAGEENLLFRALLKRTLPLLRNPAKVSESERFALLQSVRVALEDGYNEEDREECDGEPWP